MKRRKAREYALQILFMLDESNQSLQFVPTTAEQALKTYFSQFSQNQTDITLDRAHLEKMVSLILSHQNEIDTLIEKYSDNWKLSRITRVDRNILRIAACEIIYMKDAVPTNVAFDEAIEMAKLYGTDDSAAFINGVLDPLFKKEVQ